MNRKLSILGLCTAASAVALLYLGIYSASSTIRSEQPEIPAHSKETAFQGSLPNIEFEPGLAQLVNDAQNVIIDDNDCMLPFMEKLSALRSGGNGVVNILHIGDSHVQAGFWDTRMREHFARDFGSGGRGVILPHRLTGTNEPRDYYIRTSVGYEGFRTTTNPSKQKLGFTGTGVLFTKGAPAVEIWHKGGFDAVTVHHHAQAPYLAPPESLLSDMQCTMGDTGCSTTYYLKRTVDTLRLEARYAPKDYIPFYYGFTLHGGGSGVVYHSVGANSAAFEHIERNTTITDGGAGEVFPDLIIVSLGTNNCFGRNYRSAALRTVVERFFMSLAESYPGVPVLVTTPRESCNLSGGRRVPNPNIEDAAGVIRESAARFGFACWDFYNAAGGRGISEKWYQMKLSGRDRIHLSEMGYNLAGDMMYDAFIKYYNQYTALPGDVRARINNLKPTTDQPLDSFTLFRQYNDMLAAGDMRRFTDRT